MQTNIFVNQASFRLGMVTPRSLYFHIHLPLTDTNLLSGKYLWLNRDLGGRIFFVVSGVILLSFIPATMTYTFQIKSKILLDYIPWLTFWIHQLTLFLIFQAYRCMYIVLVMAVFWVTEALPLPITSMIPMVAFPLMGILVSIFVSFIEFHTF